MQIEWKDADGNSNSSRAVGKLDNDASGILPTVTSVAIPTDIESETPFVTDLEIQDIEGIGPTTEKKLKEAGIVSPMDLAVATADELATDINISKESAAAFIISTQKLLRDSKVIEKEFVTADVALEKRRSTRRCSTGSKALDELLSGGIETQAITELYGEFGSGKSQICHTLCVTARQPHSLGGLDSPIIYIDTEGTFRPERIEQIAKAKGLDHTQILRNISLCKVYNSSHLAGISGNLRLR